MSVTPESDKTVSITSQKQVAEGPTPKNEFKRPMNQRSYFNSPTDALVSPCTQKLGQQWRLPKNAMIGNQKLKYEQHSYQTRSKSTLAEKENQNVAPAKVVAQEVVAQEPTPPKIES